VLPNPALVIFIEVLTKCQVPTEAEVRALGVKKQDNGDGEYERKDFDRNFPGGCGSCRNHGCFRLDCPAAIGAGFLFAWALEPKRTEAFVGRLPYSNYLLKALAKLDLVLPARELREP
jgi:hypothetical protein